MYCCVKRQTSRPPHLPGKFGILFVLWRGATGS